jgi:hypothetical protein
MYASMIEAFGQLGSSNALAKFRDGTVTIEPTGTSTSPTCSHDLPFPDLVFPRVCTQCDVLQPTNTHYPADSHGPPSFDTATTATKRIKLARTRARHFEGRICQVQKRTTSKPALVSPDKSVFRVARRRTSRKKSVATPGRP